MLRHTTKGKISPVIKKKTKKKPPKNKKLLQWPPEVSIVKEML